MPTRSSDASGSMKPGLLLFCERFDAPLLSVLVKSSPWLVVLTILWGLSYYTKYTTAPAQISSANAGIARLCPWRSLWRERATRGTGAKRGAAEAKHPQPTGAPTPQEPKQYPSS